LAIGIAACSASQSGPADESGDAQDVKEKKSLYGDDRVGNMFKDNPELIPGTFQEIEKLFKIGRECGRTDSKEIFVVEESSSRADGEQTQTDVLLPRAVIGGCNTGDHTDPNSVANSFDMFVALISSPRAPNAAQNDPMLFTPVEVMALDHTTGTYNFYVFKTNGNGKPGTLIRVMRDPGTNKPIKFEQTAGSPAKPSNAVTNPCFSCHVNGGPIMNEMSRPWTNWVSVLKTLPKEKLGGETLSIASEAAPITDSHRSSFANDLEQIMRASLRAWVNGTSPTTGFGLMTLEGSFPGGIPLLLKSSFCETELNYVSSSDTVPVELFVDVDAANGAGLQPPPPIPGQVFPFQLPVRSEHDKRVEMYMRKRGFLTTRTITALRLVDDRHDIFSKTRCDLYPELLEGKTFTKDKPGDVDAAVKALLTSKIDSFNLTDAQKTYMQTLLDASKTDDDVTLARNAYFEELNTRFATATAQLNDANGLLTLNAYVKAQQDGARALFPGNANPLPIMN
jgi:hypothetical protein